MRRLAIVMVIFLSGCISQEACDLVQQKHAELFVYVKRINSTDKKPTPQDNEQMVKLLAKDMESLDKLLNNWKPSSSDQIIDIK